MRSTSVVEYQCRRNPIVECGLVVLESLGVRADPAALLLMCAGLPYIGTSCTVNDPYQVLNSAFNLWQSFGSNCERHCASNPTLFSTVPPERCGYSPMESCTNNGGIRCDH